MIKREEILSIDRYFKGHGITLKAYFDTHQEISGQAYHRYKRRRKVDERSPASLLSILFQTDKRLLVGGVVRTIMSEKRNLCLIFVIFAVIITAMATKIKQILDSAPLDSVFFSSWLASKGIDRKEQTLYVRSGWLERIVKGVYKIEGTTPTLYGAIASYNMQLEKRCQIGASSALDLRGYSHFVAMGKPQTYLFTSAEERLPRWMLDAEWDMTIKSFTTSLFKGDTGLEKYEYNGHQLLISGPERAFMECLHLAPVNYSLMDVYYVMEMLTTLRPKLVQQLLEECSSVKVKRLFLYMAEKAGHQWFGALREDGIDLGKSKRVVSPGGKYIGKYGLIIPKELADYE